MFYNGQVNNMILNLDILYYIYYYVCIRVYQQAVGVINNKINNSNRNRPREFISVRDIIHF